MSGNHFAAYRTPPPHRHHPIQISITIQSPTHRPHTHTRTHTLPQCLPGITSCRRNRRLPIHSLPTQAIEHRCPNRHTCPDTCHSLSPAAHAPGHLMRAHPSDTAQHSPGSYASTKGRGSPAVPWRGRPAMLRTPRLQICSPTAAPSTVVQPCLEACG